MINLSASGGSVVFTFANSTYYLYGDGTITVPVNSLSLVIDNSDIATFKKAATNDIFVAAPVAEFGMSKAELESFYKENMVGSTGGGGGGIDSGTVQSMIDASISGKADTLAVTAVDNALTAHTANTAIHVTVGDKLTWDAKSDFSGSYNDLTDKPTIPTVPTSNTAFTNDAGYATSGYVDSAVSGKQDTLVSGTNIKTINNESLLGSGNITISGGGSGTAAVEVTQAEYDALVSGGTVDPTVFYIITDASAIEASGFVQTSAITSSVTSASTDSQIPTAKAVFDAVDQGGATITVDQSLNSGSTNPISNSAVSTALNKSRYFLYDVYTGFNGKSLTKRWINPYNGSSGTTQDISFATINGNGIVGASTNYVIPSTTSAVTSGSTSAITSGAVYDQLGGLKIQPIAQADYDLLPTKDPNTLYVITNVIS